MRAAHLSGCVVQAPCSTAAAAAAAAASDCGFTPPVILLRSLPETWTAFRRYTNALLVYSEEHPLRVPKPVRLSHTANAPVQQRLPLPQGHRLTPCLALPYPPLWPAG